MARKTKTEAEELEDIARRLKKLATKSFDAGYLSRADKLLDKSLEVRGLVQDSGSLASAPSKPSNDS